MISIVTGTLNRLSLLKRVIENTVDSSDKLELVLVDGGSTDGTVEYIKSLNHERIKLVEVGGRSYYPHFMNLGIRNATYEWIVQWNDDVLIINNWEDVISQINEDYDFYIFNWKYGNFSDITNENWLNYDKQKRNSWFGCYTKESNPQGDIVMNYGIYSKKIFREIGMYDQEYKYYYADADMSERAYHFGYKFKILFDIKVCSCITPKTATHSGNENSIYVRNKSLYENKILPKNIEYLI